MTWLAFGLGYAAGLVTYLVVVAFAIGAWSRR